MKKLRLRERSDSAQYTAEVWLVLSVGMIRVKKPLEL